MEIDNDALYLVGNPDDYTREDTFGKMFIECGHNIIELKNLSKFNQNTTIQIINNIALDDSIYCVDGKYYKGIEKFTTAIANMEDPKDYLLNTIEIVKSPQGKFSLGKKQIFHRKCITSLEDIIQRTKSSLEYLLSLESYGDNLDLQRKNYGRFLG